MLLRDQIIRLAYTKPSLRPYLLPLLRTATEGELVSFVRLRSGDMRRELFLIRREGTYYAVSLEAGSSLSYGIIGAGTRAEAQLALDLEQENAEQAISLYSIPYEVTDTKADAEALQTLKFFDHPKFGLKWESATTPKVGDQFLELLKGQLRKWKGTSNSLGVTKHRGWAAFHKMVVKAVQKKYGSRVKLYRGLTGRQAEAARAGSPIPVNNYSSWAITKSGATPYSKPGGVVIEVIFRPQDIALAPVSLPDFSEPEVLRELAFDVQHTGDELVVHLPKGELTDYRVL